MCCATRQLPQAIRLLRKWLLMPFAARYVRMPGRSSLSCDLQAADPQLVARLQAHVEHLALRIGPRYQQSAREAAADYFIEQLAVQGIACRRHEFVNVFGAGTNIVAEIGPRSAPVLVIGAHYDTVPDSPGANDNATGVAALIELARLLVGQTLPLRVRFVAFDNEEHVGQPPQAMGSYAYAAECRDGREDIFGMWSLETLGCYSQEMNSQRYPAPFDLFYPTTGNFVAFVGNDRCAGFVRRCVKLFRRLSVFPCHGVAAPERFADIARSDQAGFWAAGFDGLMVTDTANFRYIHYHTADDTPEKLDLRYLALVVPALAEIVKQLQV
jgi:Zn-dependent M28 family amino/carboxypeptidase